MNINEIDNLNTEIKLKYKIGQELYYVPKKPNEIEYTESYGDIIKCNIKSIKFHGYFNKFVFEKKNRPSPQIAFFQYVIKTEKGDLLTVKDNYSDGRFFTSFEKAFESIRNKIFLLSGGFDPLHSGHLNMIEEAVTYDLQEGEKRKIWIALNSDEWLIRKKGYFLLPFHERKRILKSLSNVSGVLEVNDSDGTICEVLNKFRPAFFGNGGDRNVNNVSEIEICKKLGIECIWNLGGEKSESSSSLFENAVKMQQKNHINYNE